MSTRQTIQAAVVESSAIVRNGLVSVLKKMQDVNIITVEVTSMEGLHHCMRGHHLDLIFINPSFEGWFNLKEFKAEYSNTAAKFISILCNVTDMSLVRDYDESISLYDSMELLNEKVNKLTCLEEEEVEDEQETLSEREKEIICYVVKGLTNKEIAEQLFISVHTVMTHRRNISRKLQIHSSAGLTIYAIVNKLVELKEVKL